MPASNPPAPYTAHRDVIVCPHCGHEDGDSWEVDCGPGIEGEAEADCSDCGLPMHITRSVTVTYSTKKKQPPATA